MRRPTLLQGLPPIRTVSAGTAHAIALSEEGEVFTWGLCDQGQLGHGQERRRGAQFLDSSNPCRSW